MMSYPTRALARLVAAAVALFFSSTACAAEPELLVKGLQFPEGTIFVGDTLYFVDYGTSDVLRIAADRAEVVWHDDACGANGLIETPDGLLVACFESGVLPVVSLSGKVVSQVARDQAGQAFARPNDIAADAHGGIYLTASGSDTELGKVFYKPRGAAYREVAASIVFANGLVVSADGKRLYVGETKTDHILVYDIGADGSLSHRRSFVDLALVLGPNAGKRYAPDGIRLDGHGNFFVALYNGPGFVVFDRDGNRIAQVGIPGLHHTNLALSPDGKSVYVTAILSDQPGVASGAIYRVANPLLGDPLPDAATPATPAAPAPGTRNSADVGARPPAPAGGSQHLTVLPQRPGH